MGTRRGRNSHTHQAMIIRVRLNAVNRVVTIPAPSVTAKPRTGPLPTKNKMHAAISVEIFESRIVASARLKPFSMALTGDRPLRLFADAFVNQHVTVDRNTDREHDAGNTG